MSCLRFRLVRTAQACQNKSSVPNHHNAMGTIPWNLNLHQQNPGLTESIHSLILRLCSISDYQVCYIVVTTITANYTRSRLYKVAHQKYIVRQSGIIDDPITGLVQREQLSLLYHNNEEKGGRDGNISSSQIF